MKALGQSVLAVVALLISGCATGQMFGNYTRNSADVNSAIAEDAIRQMKILYPPGRTRFVLTHEIKDDFGFSLLSRLRASGYAVQEFAAPEPDAPLELQSAFADVAAAPGAQMELGYLLDESNSLSRLTLWVGDVAISRPYLPKSEIPIGSWMKKE
jgi:type IV secretion system protein TrbH